MTDQTPIPTDLQLLQMQLAVETAVQTEINERITFLTANYNKNLASLQNQLSTVQGRITDLNTKIAAATPPAQPAS